MANELNSPNHLTIVKFAVLNETKGAVRYQEVDDDGKHLKGDDQGAVIGSLYLRKAALDKLGKGVPKTLHVHIDI